MDEIQIKCDIRQQYKNGESVSKLIENFGRKTVNQALQGYRRSRSEANSLAHKLYPDSFKLSEDTKKKISEARKKYLKENPEKVPYKINHSSKKSWPEEIFERALIRNDIKDWVRNYRNGLYEYDFAFPLQKIDIEIDGFTHTLTKVQLIDEKRDQWSESQGWKVIRFKAKHILRDINQCIELLQNYLKNIEMNINDTIDKEFLMLRTKKERHQLEKQKKNLIKIEQKNLTKKVKSKERRLTNEIILKRLHDLEMIDKKRGYISELSNLWKITHTQVRRFLKIYADYNPSLVQIQPGPLT